MAIGCIGMSHDDFCKCTFGEFESICRAWCEMTEGQNREAWERARTVAAIAIQPHLKKGHKITPRRLLPLPWDKTENDPGHEKVCPALSAEEKIARFEELSGRVRNQASSPQNSL